MPNNDGVALGLNQPRFDLYRSFPEVPHALYVPETYEPHYRYPTIVHLHDHDASELDLKNWFPQITDTNYLGLGVRAPFPTPIGLPGQYRWRSDRPDASIAAISETLALFAQDWSVHPGRIVLLGEGQGAIVALQTLLLQQSGLFEDLPNISGVICNNLPATWTRGLPPIFNESTGRILLLDDMQTATEAALIDGLRDSDYKVTVGCPPEFTKPATINHWVMSAVNTAVY